MLTIIYGKSSSGKTTILHALKKPLSMVYDEADYEQLAEAADYASAGVDVIVALSPSVDIRFVDAENSE